MKSPNAGSGAGDAPLAAEGLFWESQPAELICKHNLFENSSWRVPEALLAPRNAVLAALGLSCQLWICNPGWLAGPALAALAQSGGVGAAQALGGSVGSSSGGTDTQTVSLWWHRHTDMVPVVAQTGSL